MLERIEMQASVPDLVEALGRAKTNDARRMLGYLLAYHDKAAQAGPALPVLAKQLAQTKGEARKHPAGAIAALASRLGPASALAAAPGLDKVLARELEEEEADAVRLDLEEALGALGRHVADDPFVTDAIRLFGFLESEHGFPAPTVETGGFSHMVAAETTSSPWRHRTNGASASRSGS